MGVWIALGIVVVIVFLVVSLIVASVPGTTWVVAGGVGALVAGLAGASGACLRAWWR